MFKSLGGKLAKGCAVALAAASLLGCTLMFSGCESKNPEISVNIEFNGEEYSLTYKLHRDLYSQTVAHYIELIDKDFFDGTVVHDFQSNRMVAGGYTYTDLENGDVLDDLTALDYDAATKDADGNVTLENITVWKDAERTQPTNRLHGETSSNGFSIEDGSGLTNQVAAEWRRGLPIELRGKLWSHQIGNALHLTREIYSMYQRHWKRHRLSIAYAYRDSGGNSTVTIGREQTLRGVGVDLSRTFG